MSCVRGGDVGGGEEGSGVGRGGGRVESGAAAVRKIGEETLGEEEEEWARWCGGY